MRLLFVMLLFSISVLAADSPFSGTWKFNPSKGHITPPIPKSSVAHIDADEENFKFSQESVDDKGSSTTSSYEAKFDGKDYAVKGDPNVDTVSLKRVSDHEIKFTQKKAGKVVTTDDVVVSKDGQTTTVNYVDYIEGKQQTGSAIYEKQ